MHQDFVPNSMDHKIVHMDVSKNSGLKPPKSSILIGFSIVNHPFWVFLPLFLETPIYFKELIVSSPVMKYSKLFGTLVTI